MPQGRYLLLGAEYPVQKLIDKVHDDTVVRDNNKDEKVLEARIVNGQNSLELHNGEGVDIDKLFINQDNVRIELNQVVSIINYSSDYNCRIIQSKLNNNRGCLLRLVFHLKREKNHQGCLLVKQNLIIRGKTYFL